MGDSEVIQEQRYSPGTILGGRYEILSELGRGGMGTVLKARQNPLNKIVAIKVLNAGLLVDRSMRSRFELEARSGADLSHPHLISVLDFGYTEEQDPYLVMEFVEGADLGKFLSTNEQPDLNQLLNIFIQVAKALQYLHERKIVHRDVKSSNILVQSIGGDCFARLLDLGIAKVLTDQGKTTNGLTVTGAIFGSFPYMSPEQCQGQQIDGRSDIYAFGCVIYECLAGKVPFEADNHLQMMMKHVSVTAEKLPYMNATEKKLSDLVQKCLEKNPADRYQSMTELIEELRAISGAPKLESQKSKESKAPLLLCGVIALVCITFGGTCFFLNQSNNSAVPAPAPLQVNKGADRAVEAKSQAMGAKLASTSTAPQLHRAPKTVSKGAKAVTKSEATEHTTKSNLALASGKAPGSQVNGEAPQNGDMVDALRKAAEDRKRAEQALKAATAERLRAEKLAKQIAVPDAAVAVNSVGTPVDQNSHGSQGQKKSAEARKKVSTPAERRASLLATAIHKFGLMDARVAPVVEQTFFAQPQINPASIASALQLQLVELGHQDIAVTMPPGEHRVLIRESTGNARSVEFQPKSEQKKAEPASPTAITAKLAQVIAESGLMNAAVEPAIQETFFSHRDVNRADLAAALETRLHQLGHPEIGVTLPAGENRVLIRDNNTGNARSVQF